MVKDDVKIAFSRHFHVVFDVRVLDLNLSNIIKLVLIFLFNVGCDHSRFLVVPDWYANGCCRVLALEQTQ